MPMTLDQFADHLDTRDLIWPAPPEVHRPKAKPKLTAMPHVRLVTWNLYGTLLNIFGGQLYFEHPQQFVMDIALDKTVQEFKMWGSMSRKPGQPAEYMGEMYRRVLSDLRLASSPNEKYPEVLSERIWEEIVKKLQKKEYKYDAASLGPIGELSRKIAYFFHASLQGVGCYDGAAQALDAVRQAGRKQALIADAQSFSLLQLKRGLARQHFAGDVDFLFDRNLHALSCEVGGRKPSERLFKHLLTQAASQGIMPAQVLHVGSRLLIDLAPAKKLGMRTALFAGDKDAIQATPEQLKDHATRPDAMLTELTQIADLLA